jgi:hypothetical protein
VFERASWYKNSPSSWVLKMPYNAGGAVLATIHEYRGLYHWKAGNEAHPHLSLYGAQRAARRALREGVVTAEQE